MKRSDWQGQAGETWAAEWKRTDRGFTMLTEELLRRSRDFAFTQALDIGCGAGELALALGRGRPAAEVLGVDISPDLVAAARRRAANLANVAFVEADAATWRPVSGFSPELLISRHGVMFFDDPPAAFANLGDAAASGAGLLFSCFRPLSENPFFTEVARLLPEQAAPPAPPPMGAPGPFGFADPEHVCAVLTAGGWSSIGIEPFDFAMIAGAGEDPVAEAIDYFSAIGPAAMAASELDVEARERFFDRLAAMARGHCREGMVALPAAAWIVTARKGT